MTRAGVLAVVAAVAGALVAVIVVRSGPDGPLHSELTTAFPPSDAGRFRDAPPRRLSRVVRGTRFSFGLRTCCWERGPIKRPLDLTGFRNGNFFISKSTVGPQGAEAILLWTSFPDGDNADPCANLLRRPIGDSAADLASAMARTPGIELLRGPSHVTVGGRPGQHVVLRVLLDIGCDPAFFFTWRPRGPSGECWGGCWLESNLGDTIRVWIVDVGGTRLVLEAETSDEAGPHVEEEIRQIVASIRFDR